MESPRNRIKTVAGYALILGILYLVFGVLTFVANVTEVGLMPPIRAESWGFFSGAAMAFIGVVYFYGWRRLWRGEERGYSFFIVAFLLSVVFGIVALIVMAAHGIGAGMDAEEFGNFVFVEEFFRPEIMLFLISLPLCLPTLRAILRRGRKPTSHS
jgi:hypothetical protein